MSEIQTFYPSGLFRCKRCGGTDIRQRFVDRLSTGVNLTEIKCNDCMEWYLIRWVEESPQKLVITRRKYLCVDDMGREYMVSWTGIDSKETANAHLGDGRLAKVRLAIARRNSVS